MEPLAVSDLGEGSIPIVLLHGLFGNARNLGSVARALSRQARVLNMDLPGHGASPHLPAYSPGSMAQAVGETLDALDVGQFSLLGHSLGGKVAMEIALAMPRAVNRLLVADIAPVRYEPRHTGIFAALRQLPLAQLASRTQAEALLAQSLPEPGLRHFLLQNLRREDARFYWRFDLAGLERDYAALSDAVDGRGRQYTGPALFVAGAESDYLQPPHHPACRALFGHAHFERIEGAGHWLHADKPGAFLALAQKFFIAE